MTVRVYRHDDASAPQLSSAAGTLINVLSACLVTGYGAKVAADWDLAFTGTNLAAYRAKTGLRHYLRIADTTNATTARATGYEAMTDINTGTGDYPAAAQISGGLHWRKSDTTGTTTWRPWMVIADEKRFYLYVGQASTEAASIEGSTSYAMLYFFGEIDTYLASDQYHSMILGGTSTTATVGSYFAGISTSSTALAGHYMARAVSQTGGSTQYSKSSDQRGGTTTIATAGADFPDPVSAGMLLAPIYVQEPGTRATRGILPGAWQPLHSLPGSPGDTFAGRGELVGKSFVLLDCANGSTRGRVAIETSSTWGV